MDDRDIRALQMIYVAQILGTSVFAAVMLFVSFQAFQKGVAPTANQLMTVRMLVMAMSAAVGVLYFVAGVLFKKLLPDTIEPTAPVEKVASKIKTAFIARIALFEAAAFFGLIVFTLSGLFGVLHAHPAYALTSLPYFILVGMAASTFPSRERLQSLVSQKTASK